MTTSTRLPELRKEMRRWLGEMETLWPFGRRWPFVSPFLAGEPWAPAVDIIEKDGFIVVKADLPGVKREDVDITVEDGTLAIRAERKQEEEVKEEGYRRSERSYGRFERILPLPEGVDPDAIRASYRDGVLEITVPVKREEREAAVKKVAIE